MVDHLSVGSSQTERETIVKIQNDLQKAIQDSLELRDVSEADSKTLMDNLNHAIKSYNNLYQRELKSTLNKYTGLDSDGNLTYCMMKPE